MKNISTEKNKISIIIVNYNVRDFLLHSIQSIIKALNKITHEIIVVDNASVDGSVQSVKKLFPQVSIIENESNIGFSAANNMAIKSASGNYIVLINPDTLVQEDTFIKLLNFMDDHPNAGAATCKIINPDGSFSVDSRHSIPTPSTALWKLLGLNRLFPKSKIFGRYNLTYLDPDDTYPVDAISGSFMFLRKKAIDQIGLLDEAYFMYCEDVDYCYRLGKKGWKIYYVPDSSIIHYKGESTKKSNVDYVINFNKSLYTFYKKHFHKRSFAVFRWIVLAGVIFRGIVIYIKIFFAKFYANLFDIFVLNLTIFLTFYLRFEIKSVFKFDDFWNQYIYVHIMATIIFFSVAFFYDLYGRYRFSFSRILKTNLVTFFIVAAITFFLKELAFSRMIVIISAVISPIMMIIWRLLGIRKSGLNKQGIFNTKTLLVGTDEEARKILKRLKKSIETSYEICGLVTSNVADIGSEIEGIQVVTHIDNLHKFVRLEKISNIIFSTHNISYERILKSMSEMTDLKVDFKIVPEKMDVMIGKSTVEKLDDYPLIDIDYPIGKSFNKYSKRIIDFTVSFPICLFTAPIWITILLLFKNKLIKREQSGFGGNEFSVYQSELNPYKGFKNICLLMPHVFMGNISLVGSPLKNEDSIKASIPYKPGITGIIQINKHKIRDSEEIKRYSLYYLKNQNVWLDFKILFRYIFNK